MEPWFDQQMAGMIGGIMGSAIGIGGGVFVGGMSNFYIRKGLKKLAYSLYALSFFVGVFLLAIGLIGLLAKQPYYVWWPFILSGGILAVVVAGVFPVIRKRFAEHEKRVMAIEDL